MLRPPTALAQSIPAATAPGAISAAAEASHMPAPALDAATSAALAALLFSQGGLTPATILAQQPGGGTASPPPAPLPLAAPTPHHSAFPYNALSGPRSRAVPGLAATPCHPFPHRRCRSRRHRSRHPPAQTIPCRTTFTTPSLGTAANTCDKCLFFSLFFGVVTGCPRAVRQTEALCSKCGGIGQEMQGGQRCEGWTARTC